MSYPKQTLRLQPTRGLNLDVAGHELGPDYWTVAENVQFRDGFPQRILGSRNVYTSEITTIAPDNFVHALNARSPSTNFWLTVQSNGQAHAIQPGSQSRIDNNLLTAQPRVAGWSSCTINGIPIISNALSEPVYWPFSGNVLKLPDWPSTESAGFIAVLKFHVFAMNISGGSGVANNQVKWSSATEPGTVPASWTPAPGNDAGSAILADTPGAVLCAYPLGESLYFYKRNAAYQCRFIGGQSTFQFRRVEAAIGALSSRAVCDIGGAHLVVTDGDILLFDGVNKRSVGESVIRDYFFNNIDPNRFEELFCIYNQPRDEVLIAWPQKSQAQATSGSPANNRALIYDISRDAFGFRDLPETRYGALGFINDAAPGNTWADRTETWADAVGTWADNQGTSAQDSLVLVNEKALSQQDIVASVPLNSRIGKSGLTFGDPERIKFVRQVHLRTNEPFGRFFVRVGGQLLPNGPMTWSGEVEITRTEQIVPITAAGRYIAVEVRSDDGQIWKLTGIDIEAELRGYY